jgi:hypothetical protein
VLPAGATHGSYSDHYGAYSAAYGQQITDKFSVGATRKWINAKLADVSANAFADDFGSLYQAADRLRLTLAGFYVITLRAADNLGAIGISTKTVLVISSVTLPPTAPPAQAPTLLSLTPAILTAGDPGFTLTIKGGQLSNGCTAYWNTTPLITHVVNSAQVSAVVPKALLVSLGTAAIHVDNPGSATSNTLYFSLVKAPLVPLLNWSAHVLVNATLTLTPRAGSTYEWTFIPRAAAPASFTKNTGHTSATSGFATITPAPSLSIGPLNLNAGNYVVQVRVINAAGKTSDPAQAQISLVQSELSTARVYPNPWKAALGQAQITFDQLPAGSHIKIFTVSGRWVASLSASSGSVLWPLTNDSGEGVGSGIYLYVINAPDGSKTRGTLTLIR